MNGTGALAVAGFSAGLYFIAGLNRALPDASFDGAVAVSVIVPARNEARSLPLLLADLARQTLAPAEIVVVDDASDDGTGEVARAAGVRVIRVDGPPPGWTGKNWACWNGYRHATGDVLVFLDADVRLSPRALELLVGYARRTGRAVSVQPHFAREHWWESLSFMFWAVGGISMAVGGEGFFGAAICLTREQYERAGTHAAVRGAVLDDIELGKAVRRSGTVTEVVRGGPHVRIRMHPDGAWSMVRGWGRSFSLGAVSVPPWIFALVFLWVSAVIGAGARPLVALFDGSGSFGFHDVVRYLVAAIEVYLVGRQIGDFGPVLALFHFVPSLFFATLFIASTLRTVLVRQVSWKGRRIRLVGAAASEQDGERP